MKRDMDLIREILLQKEAEKNPMTLSCTKEEFTYHVALLKEGGLVEAIIQSNHVGMPSKAVVIRLTMAGHDFLDSARNENVWHKAKEHIIKSGTAWTFSILAEVLKSLAKQQLAQFGLPSLGGQE